MKRIVVITAALLGCMAARPALATNGDNLIGVGPVSRSMGGVGVAAPQDSISAIFVNPAAMNFCPCGTKSESILAATIFDPTVGMTLRTPFGVFGGTSQHEPFVIPAVGVVAGINDQLRFGFGAYGVSGLGVDYRNLGIDLDGDPSNGFEGDLYTRLEVMRFAPMFSYKVNDTLSVGAALQASYNNLDLGAGGSHDYSYGGSVGVLYARGRAAVGASYALPQKASHERVFNFDAFLGDTQADTLDLEAPGVAAVGAAYEVRPDWLVGVDVKHIAWGEAEGYKDFDWDDQVVAAVGTQYAATDKLTLRAGYNYGESPVQVHNGFDPMGVSTVQGKAVPTLGYELLRTVGFPAIVEHHLTLGAGYKLAPDVQLAVSYMRALEETIRQTSAGGAFDIESSLKEDSVSMSVSWLF